MGIYAFTKDPLHQDRTVLLKELRQMGIYAFTKDPLHQDTTVLLKELRQFFLLHWHWQHQEQDTDHKVSSEKLLRYNYTTTLFPSHFDLFHSKQNADRLSSGHQP